MDNLNMNCSRPNTKFDKSITPKSNKLEDSVLSSPITAISHRKTTESGIIKKPQTRLATEVFGLGSSVCADDAAITGVRLPMCMQVLRCMMYHTNVAAKTERPGSMGAPSRFTTWWITCKKTVDAPWNDLQLYKRLQEYKVVDKAISQSAIRALNRHLWYLTAEMVPLALFSEQVPLLERQALADALLKVKPMIDLQAPLNRFGNGWGKPRFPLSIDRSTRLCDLAQVDSWFTIYRLQLDTNFLQLPVDEWNKSAAYILSADNVEAINVVNDGAERGVKLASDFVETARSEKHFQNVLQVVEKDRRDNPNLRLKRENITALQK